MIKSLFRKDITNILVIGSVIIYFTFILIIWQNSYSPYLLTIKPGETRLEKYHAFQSNLNVEESSVDIYEFKSNPTSYIDGYNLSQNLDYQLEAEDYYVFTRYLNSGSKLNFSYSFNVSTLEFYQFPNRDAYQLWIESELSDTRKAIYTKETSNLTQHFELNDNSQYYFVIYNPFDKQIDGAIKINLDATMIDLNEATKFLGSELQGYDISEPKKLVYHNPTNSDIVLELDVDQKLWLKFFEYFIPALLLVVSGYILKYKNTIENIE